MLRFLLLLGAALALSACPPAKKCDLLTCATGCCGLDGVCKVGDSASACGTGGATCAVCTPSACSAARVCDFGGAGGGGGGGGASGGRTVVVTETNRYATETGTVETRQLDDAGIAVFTVSGTTFTVVPGVRTAEQYTAMNVPAGPYVVRYGTLYVVATSDTLDLGSSNHLGRFDRRFIEPQASSLTLAVAGMPAWGDMDELHFFSQGAELYAYGATALTSGPTAGQVPTSFSLDYGALYFGGAPAVEASKGDSLYVVHMPYRELVQDQYPGAAEDGGVELGPFGCWVSGAWARVSNLNVMSGPNAAAATFDGGSQRSLRLQIPRNQWRARATEVIAGARLVGEDYYVTAAPVPGSTSADLVACLSQPGSSAVLADVDTTLSAGDPYPSTWTRSAWASLTFTYPAPVLDAGTWSSRGSVSSDVSLGAPLAPAVHSPIGVKVNDQQAWELETLSASSPFTVSWGASAQAPVATEFLVQLMRMERVEARTQRTQVVAALTRETSVVFPPHLMEPGGIYFIRVRARVNSSPATKPYERPSSSAADAVTRPFMAR